MYRIKHSIYEVQYYPWFQAPTGDRGMGLPRLGGRPCRLHTVGSGPKGPCALQGKRQWFSLWGGCHIWGYSQRPQVPRSEQRSSQSASVLCHFPSHLVATSFWPDRKISKIISPLLSASIVFLEDLSGCLPEYDLNTQSIQVENKLIPKLWLWQNKLLQPFISFKLFIVNLL